MLRGGGGGEAGKKGRDSRRVRCPLVDLCPRDIGTAEAAAQKKPVKPARREVQAEAQAQAQALAVLRSRPVLLFDLGAAGVFAAAR